ncbi:MAG: methylmalonyl-CoA epimerase [Flavobacteriaceae bacterium]|nr:methylmalonyl-CoA epimerase [Flavobacteriaceae bacterium]
MHLEHIGIAVKDLEASKQVFDALFGFQSYKTEPVESEQVNTVFYQTGQSKVELLQGLGETDSISKFVEKKGEGIHHLAFEVSDIQAEITRLEAMGFQFVSSIPKAGADNKMICFLHPKSTNGVLIELCQMIL